jgi:hypothetical protein
LTAPNDVRPLRLDGLDKANESVKTRDSKRTLLFRIFYYIVGVLGRIAGGLFVRHKLERLFAYRHHTTINDVITHATYKGDPMNILVTGAGGLVGKALLAFLAAGGHQVTRLVRTPPRPDAVEVQWDSDVGIREVERLEGYDAVVHLAGENIATGRWTPEKKDRIRRSRVHGTTVLCEALARLSRPPKVLVSASAIGYYGDRGAEPLGEESPPGSGFLPEVCQAWEAATAAAARKGIRVVPLRLGIVLSPTDGALAKMLPPFKLGVGGVLGSGRQYMSWITLDDVIGAIHHAIITESLRGPVNATAPSPVTNREFTTTLGRVLHRPTILPVPAFAARFAFGEMADALLLASARVEPQRLLASRYAFRHPELEGALRHLLGKPSPPL